MNYIGIDIGGTKCALCRWDEKGNILKKIAFDTAGAPKTLERIFAATSEMMPAAAIGISCGGPLDEKAGVILSPPNLLGWDNIEIVNELYKRFKIPAYLLNDANASALAEWKFGAGVGAKNLIFLTFGTGMGAGLILGGRLYSGASGFAGEAGHIRLGEFGPVGYGKAGSFEGFCSGGGIAQLGKTAALERLQMGEGVSFCKDFDQLGSITAKEIAKYAIDGCPVAREIFKISGENLGYALSILIDILNPELIIIGSIFARCEGLLAPHAKRVIEREALSGGASACSVVPALLGDSIGDFAALCAAINGGGNGSFD